MLRHIIVEGPDGSGKTTLIDKLSSALRMPLHKRASDSIKGPELSTLDVWVNTDVNLMHRAAPSIYDRHPLVSEPIYGPVCRGKVPGMFNQDWWVKTMTTRTAHYALLVMCLPPLDVCQEGMSSGPQMAGVEANYVNLYHSYQRAVWPGVQVRYDRTRSDIMSILPAIRKVIGSAGV